MVFPCFLWFSLDFPWFPFAFPRFCLFLSISIISSLFSLFSTAFHSSPLIFPVHHSFPQFSQLFHCFPSVFRWLFSQFSIFPLIFKCSPLFLTFLLFFPCFSPYSPIFPRFLLFSFSSPFSFDFPHFHLTSPIFPCFLLCFSIFFCCFFSFLFSLRFLLVSFFSFILCSFFPLLPFVLFCFFPSIFFCSFVFPPLPFGLFSPFSLAFPHFPLLPSFSLVFSSLPFSRCYSTFYFHLSDPGSSPTFPHTQLRTNLPLAGLVAVFQRDTSTHTAALRMQHRCWFLPPFCPTADQTQGRSHPGSPFCPISSASIPPNPMRAALRSDPLLPHCRPSFPSGPAVRVEDSHGVFLSRSALPGHPCHQWW